MMGRSSIEGKLTKGRDQNVPWEAVLLFLTCAPKFPIYYLNIFLKILQIDRILLLDWSRANTDFYLGPLLTMSGSHTGKHDPLNPPMEEVRGS